MQAITVINFKHIETENKDFFTKKYKTSFIYGDYYVEFERVEIKDYFSEIIRIKENDINKTKNIKITKQFLPKKIINELKKIDLRKKIEKNNFKNWLVKDYDEYLEYINNVHNSIGYYKTNLYDKEDN